GHRMTDACQSRDRAEPRVDLQGATSQPYRLGHPFAGRQIVLRHSTEIKIIGGEVLWSSPRRHFNFCLIYLWLNSRDNGERYFVLKSKNVGQVTLKPVRPDVRACNRIDQLPCDANFPRRLPHRPLEDIAHAEPSPDLLDIDRSALEGEARIASDHEQRLEARQRGDDVFDDTVGKVFLLGIATHVLER